MNPIDEVTFLRKLQRLLEEGDFVATYKFALLQALADLSVETGPASDGTLGITLGQLSEKFIEYYWRQAKPYRDGIPLAQNTGKQAAIVSRVAETHARYDASLPGARRAQRDWTRLVTTVARTVEIMPLWKLQVVGGQVDEFLYRRDHFSGSTVLLQPGIARCFRTFYPFIVNMVRGAWINHLLRIRQNQEMLGERGDLSEFLFGSERRPLDTYRAILREHQRGRCFYCDSPVKTSQEALDHFIPWTRYPVDLGHNFVLTDVQCNKHKRDHLAHTEHLAKWSERNLGHARELADEFNRKLLRHDAERTRKVAYWAYEQAELSGSRVWMQADGFSALPTDWKEALNFSIR